MVTTSQHHQSAATASAPELDAGCVLCVHKLGNTAAEPQQDGHLNPNGPTRSTMFTDKKSKYLTSTLVKLRFLNEN